MWIFAVSAMAAPEYAVSVARRPPTLPKNDIRITVNGTVGVRDPLSAGALIGGGIGITDQFEVGAWLIPLALAPDFAYLDPSLYLTYGGELSKKVYLAPLLRLSVPVTNGSAALLDAQVELGAQLGKDALLTIAPTAALHFADGGPYNAFGAPVALLVQPSRRFFFAIETGIGTDPFSWQYQAPRYDGVEGITVPAGARIGTSTGKLKGGTLFDLSAGAYWPALLAGDTLDAGGVTIVAEISSTLLSDRGKKGGGGKKGRGKK